MLDKIIPKEKRNNHDEVTLQSTYHVVALQSTSFPPTTIFMGASILSALGYAIALYWLVIQSFYVYIHLPIAVDISSGFKEWTKSQMRGLTFCSAFVSLSYLSLLFWLSVLRILRGSTGLATSVSPELKTAADEHTAERKAKEEGENKKMPSKRAVWGRTVLNIFSCTVIIVNDAIFNCPKDAASFKGFFQRFEYLGQTVIFTQIGALAFMSLLAVVLYVLWTIGTLVFFLVRRTSRLFCSQSGAIARADADEESRLAPNEMIEVEEPQNTTTRWHVLEGKLIDLSDGIDAVYEKMESYAAPRDATKQEDEEPSIEL
ncbi:hypothetical protein GYMLUDRAFT_245961 [Collybiopsis luxurians FD-317 M1]|uniref:Uncharacterized protein n=1 Tax=Collybiopsis luxurians FD-317 M1 TaxID=944289 RepID=A0A0D0B5E1_9AGAR|nr:hypothetical protein GYMLUDRAFT_245961 [Collybiopsis luxurians FD-317 M1]